MDVDVCNLEGIDPQNREVSKGAKIRNRYNQSWKSGLGVIKLESILRHKIKRNDWLIADTCPQAANNCALF